MLNLIVLSVRHRMEDNYRLLEEVEDIAACGAGTVSKRVFHNGRIERCDTVKDLDQYIGRIGEMIERKQKLYQDKHGGDQ